MFCNSFMLLFGYLKNKSLYFMLQKIRKSNFEEDNMNVHLENSKDTSKHNKMVGSSLSP